DNNRLTYSQLRENADKLAIGLAGLGVKKGDCVLVQLPNWCEFAYTFFALQKIGAPAVLLLTRHMQVEINLLCELTKAKTWIVPVKYRNTDYHPVINDVVKENPELNHIITVRSSENEQYINLEDLISSPDPDEQMLKELSWQKPDADEISFIIPTGGTTGLSKVVPRTHNSAVCEARYKAEARNQDTDDICLISVPLEHNLGLATMTSTIYSSGKIVFLDSTRPVDFYDTVQREKVTCAPLVPTLLSRLVNFSDINHFDTSSLAALYTGGAKTTADVIRSVYEKIGRVYVSAFGMSEGPTCTTRQDDNDDTIFNTIGKPCCPHDEFKVVDTYGRELPRGTEGELIVKGPGMFSGYFNNQEENRRAFTSDGFFITGDLALIENSGNIRITGRKKDIIIRGGENISPSEIEAMIIAHPCIADVAVIGIPYEEMGERICAYIQPGGKTPPTFEDIIAY
ncbi:MAG: AMP-binding protein, partial [Dehalococcoidales bacterium]